MARKRKSPPGVPSVDPVTPGDGPPPPSTNRAEIRARLHQGVLLAATLQEAGLGPEFEALVTKVAEVLGVAESNPPKRAKRRSDDDVRSTIGRNVGRLREAAEINRAELARRAGVTTIQVSRVERGIHAPGVGLALRLAAALGVSIEDLAAPKNSGDGVRRR